MVLEDFVTYANTVTDIITVYAVTPLLIFFAGIAAGRIARNLLRVALEAVEADSHAQRITGQPVPAVELASGTVAALIYAVTTVLALQAATILDDSLQLVAIVLSVFAVIAIALGVRDFLPNYLAGRKSKKKLRIGDSLRVNGLRGEVCELGRLSVQIRTEHEEHVAIPYTLLREV